MRVVNRVLKLPLICVAVVAFGIAGYRWFHGGIAALLLAGVFSLAAATLWVIFAAPWSRRRLSDAPRFLFEAALFFAASWALVETGTFAFGIALFAVYLLNEALLHAGRSDSDTMLKLFPHLNTLGSIFFGFALALSYGEVAQSTSEFMLHPDLLHIFMVVVRPGLVLISWYFFAKTLLYKERPTPGLFTALILALISISVVEFGLAGLPLVPDAAFYNKHPEAIHLLELISYALAAYFAAIGYANALSYGRTLNHRAKQARGNAIYAGFFAVGSALTGLGLNLEVENLWGFGLVMFTIAIVVSIWLGIVWREPDSLDDQTSAAA